MPVKSSNVVLYPGGSLASREWKEIREEVLKREGNCCKICKAPNHASILRVKAHDFEHYVNLETLEAFDAATGERLGLVPADSLPVGKSTRVVLHVDYLDRNSGRVGKKGHRPNLIALCQHCAHQKAMKDIEKALAAAEEEARIKEFGPPLPLFG